MSAARDEERRIAREMRLRAPAPIPVRLSRRAVALTAAVAALAIAAVCGWALAEHPRKTPAIPPPAPVEAATPPEALAALPRDYLRPPADAPRLGPPLSPVFGRAQLASGGVGAAVPADPESSVRRQALAQAAASRLIAVPGTPSASRSDLTVPSTPVAATASPAPFVLAAGTLIPAAMVTAVRSDLPGPVVAQVTETIRDGQSGQSLVPQGSRVLGAYEAKLAAGQDRLAITWAALQLPDGRRIELPGAVAADPQGRVGTPGKLDARWRELAAASLVTLGLSAASQVAVSGEGDLARAFRGGVSDTATQVGARVVDRGLGAAPSISIPAGEPVRILLTRDLALEAWTETSLVQTAAVTFGGPVAIVDDRAPAEGLVVGALPEEGLGHADAGQGDGEQGEGALDGDGLHPASMEQSDLLREFDIDGSCAP